MYKDRITFDPSVYYIIFIFTIFLQKNTESLISSSHIVAPLITISFWAKIGVFFPLIIFELFELRKMHEIAFRFIFAILREKNDFGFSSSSQRPKSKMWILTGFSSIVSKLPRLTEFRIVLEIEGDRRDCRIMQFRAIFRRFL